MEREGKRKGKEGKGILLMAPWMDEGTLVGCGSLIVGSLTVCC